MKNKREIKGKIKNFPVVPPEVEEAWKEYSKSLTLLDKDSSRNEEVRKIIRTWCESAGFRVNPDYTLAIPEFKGNWIQSAHYLRALSFMMGELRRFSNSKHRNP
jgi:hypothetical protein